MWLGILGEWGSIGYGFLIMFGGPILLSLSLAPSLLLAMPSTYFLDRGHSIPFYLLAFLSCLYVIALMTVWCGAILYIFASRADASSFVPSVIWSYGVAMGPWQYMAQKETQGGGGDASSITTFFAQIGYVVVIVLAIFVPVSLLNLLTVFGSLMLVGLVFQFIAAVQATRFSLRGGY